MQKLQAGNVAEVGVAGWPEANRIAARWPRSKCRFAGWECPPGPVARRCGRKAQVSIHRGAAHPRLQGSARFAGGFSRDERSETRPHKVPPGRVAAGKVPRRRRGARPRRCHRGSGERPRWCPARRFYQESAVDVAGHFHEFGRGEVLQVFEDGFDHAHVTILHLLFPSDLKKPHPISPLFLPFFTASK
jgi:hypothetical protein